MNVFIQSRSRTFGYQWYEVKSNGEIFANSRAYDLTDQFCRLVPPYHAAAMFLQGQTTRALLLAGLDTGRQDIGNRAIGLYLLVVSQNAQEVYGLADHFVGQGKWPPDSGGEFFRVFRNAIEAGIAEDRPDISDAGCALREYLSKHSRTSLPLREAALIPPSVTNYDPERVTELLSWLSITRISPGDTELRAMVVTPWQTAPPEVRCGWDTHWDKIPIVIYEGGPRGWQARRPRFETVQEQIVLVQPIENRSASIRPRFPWFGIAAAGAIALGASFLGMFRRG
jgi:hypothetical protein